MQELVSKTIDKLSFRINIPIFLAICWGIWVVASGYFNLMSNMALLQAGQNSILAKLDNNTELHKLRDVKQNAFDVRLGKVETKLDMKLQ